MGRPPLDLKQRQLAVALPPDVRTKLEIAAKAADRSLAEEIRRRINVTLARDATNPVTRELLEGIENLATLWPQDLGEEWYADPTAHEAFTEAVTRRLNDYKPVSFDELIGQMRFAGPEFSPKTLGRVRERDDRRRNLYPHLIEAQERWATAKKKTRSVRRAHRKRGVNNE